MQNKFLSKLLILSILLVAACKKEDTLIKRDADVAVNSVVAAGKYSNGFFVANEGWYPHESGSISFYDYSTKAFTVKANEAENPTVLGPLSSTLQFATIFNHKIYAVLKVGGPMVILNESTLKEIARVNPLPNNNGQAFVGVDTTRGLISTTNGVYPINLQTLAIGAKISAISGSATDMIKAGNFVFVLTTSGIVALNAGDYSLAKSLGAAKTGFAIGKDGNVYAATTSAILQINTATLAVTSTPVAFSIWYNQFVYTNSSITASTVDNAIYVQSGNNLLYRYLIGNTASLSTPFITLPSGRYFYGKGLAYDPDNNTLVLTTAERPNAFGGQDNRYYIYNASTAAATDSIKFTGWLFPAMPFFH